MVTTSSLCFPCKFILCSIVCALEGTAAKKNTPIRANKGRQRVEEVIDLIPSMHRVREHCETLCNFGRS